MENWPGPEDIITTYRYSIVIQNLAHPVEMNLPQGK